MYYNTQAMPLSPPDYHHKPDLAGITEPGGQRMEENKVTVTARETKAAEGEMIQR